MRAAVTPDGTGPRPTAVTSGPVRLTIGDDSFDLDLRPLVIARPGGAHADGDDLVRYAKEAVSQGADLVELDAATLSPRLVTTLEAATIPVVARIVGPGAVAWFDGVVGVTLQAGAVPPASAPGSVVRFSADPTLLRPGDGRLVDPRAVTPGDPGPGVAGIVDLGASTDRALLAAAVADALAHGAQGFVTTTPTPVRRAAHVIRAVEHAT